MTRRKLEKLKQQLESLRRSAVKTADMQRLAASLGRKLFDRGKEPTWISTEFPHLRPLSIPDHGNRDLRTGTKHSILQQLEDDILEWEIKLTNEPASEVDEED